jgi:hypothetical protein
MQHVSIDRIGEILDLDILSVEALFAYAGLIDTDGDPTERAVKAEITRPRFGPGAPKGPIDECVSCWLGGSTIEWLQQDEAAQKYLATINRHHPEIRSLAEAQRVLEDFRSALLKMTKPGGYDLPTPEQQFAIMANPSGEKCLDVADALFVRQMIFAAEKHETIRNLPWAIDRALWASYRLPGNPAIVAELRLDASALAIVYRAAIRFVAKSRGVWPIPSEFENNQKRTGANEFIYWLMEFCPAKFQAPRRRTKSNSGRKAA